MRGRPSSLLRRCAGDSVSESGRHISRNDSHRAAGSMCHLHSQRMIRRRPSILLVVAVATMLVALSPVRGVRGLVRARCGLRPRVLSPGQGQGRGATRWLFSASSTGSAEAGVTAKVVAIKADIDEAGSAIRNLKAASADKEALEPHIAKLLELKAQYEELTGSPFDPPKKQKQKQKAPEASKQASQKGGKEASSNVITPRCENYSQWYLDIISAAELVDNSPVKGCMVIRPWGMAIWDLLREELDSQIKESGAQNAYFPLFIPQSFLSKEADHVEGFAKECAVVTHHRLCANPDGSGLMPDPDAKLEEPLIVRPTSETIIWNMFGKWIDSHRDLPLKLNQWANVVRWELRTRPFLRSAEFLWQEGHTAHATRDDALATARQMLGVYSDTVAKMLALPVIRGVKSPMERFAGADETFTIEALVQNGWALQSGTSHFLGQNFARAFDVYFQNKEGERELVWATSWGVSTRLMGALVMTHSDDAGLRLPPAVAPHQVVIVPITKGKGEEDAAVQKAVDVAVDELKAKGVRVKVDDRDHLRPGAKYFEWERKGVPLRLEVGPRDAKVGCHTLHTYYPSICSELISL
jgi:prolyl-tRNA synthetase